MPPSRRLHLLLIPLAALIAISPLLRDGPTCGHDLDFHLLSWLEAAQQFAHGNLHPHWAFTPAYNAGEPRFVFYPPLSWTIGALLTLLLTHLPHVTPQAAFTAAPILYIGLALTAAGLAMHALARRYVAAPVALLAATLYLANPYTLFTAYERTAFSELLAAAWIPLLLLAILPPQTGEAIPHTPSLSMEPTASPFSSGCHSERSEEPASPPKIPAPPPPRIPLLALAVALLWLTNAPAAVMGCYTLALLTVVHLLSLYRQHQDLRLLLRPAARYTAGTLLGLALAAFYILPAAYQQRWVEINLATVPGMRIADNTLFHHTPDPDHDAVLHTASLIAVTLLTATAAALLISTIVQRRRPFPHHRNPSSRPEAQPKWRTCPEPAEGDPRISPLAPHESSLYLFTTLSLLTAVIAILLTPIAAPIWRHAPKLAFLQFPWRLLAILAPVCALTIALALRTLRTPIALTLALLAPAALTLAAYPAFHQACDIPDTPQAQLTAFRSQTGSDPTDEYTPTTADNDALHPNHPAWTLLPPHSTALQPTGEAPTHLDLDLPTPETLVLNLRDYPAWQIIRNGNPVPDRLPRPDGLLAIPLPPGRSHIDLIYRTTPDQLAGDAISLAALCVFTPLAVVSLRRRNRPQP